MSGLGGRLYIVALYRKYRPASFAEVIGQDHVTRPLSVALDSGRINHAYLFTGPRGCGKTSSARILARSLNCVQGPTSTPCGVCNSCVSLAPGGPGNLDVVELDAASHNGVDDMRDLRDRATYAPAESRYRIFIIDEAHMITTQGFNALLKIVEEPPEHLIFIFATTEPEKVIGTIRSRTHNYPFRLLAPPADDVRALGADIIIDYRNEDFVERLANTPVDIVVDTQGGDITSRSLQVLRRGGVVVGIAGSPEPTLADQAGAGPVVKLALSVLSFRLRRQARKLGVRYRFLFIKPDGAALRTVAELVDEGILKPVVDRVLPFNDTLTALNQLLSGKTRGKVLVTTNPEEVTADV